MKVVGQESVSSSEAKWLCVCPGWWWWAVMYLGHQTVQWGRSWCYFFVQGLQQEDRLMGKKIIGTYLEKLILRQIPVEQMGCMQLKVRVWNSGENLGLQIQIYELSAYRWLSNPRSSGESLERGVYGVKRRENLGQGRQLPLSVSHPLLLSHSSPMWMLGRITEGTNIQYFKFFRRKFGRIQTLKGIKRQEPGLHT